MFASKCHWWLKLFWRNKCLQSPIVNTQLAKLLKAFILYVHAWISKFGANQAGSKAVFVPDMAKVKLRQATK